MDANTRLSKLDGTLLKYISQYRRLLGRLQYVTISRLDISYSVNCLSQFMDAPRDTHLKDANRILHYLKDTIGHGLLFKCDNTLNLQGYI